MFLDGEQALFVVSCSRTSGGNVPCALVSGNEEFRRTGKALEAVEVHCEGTPCLKAGGEEGMKSSQERGSGLDSAAKFLPWQKCVNPNRFLSAPCLLSLPHWWLFVTKD